MTPPAGEASAKAIRQQRARRLAIRFALWVGIPTFLSTIYYGCMVNQQYESFAIVSVELVDRSAMDESSGGSPSARDARLVVEYIQSRAMSDLLADRYGFAAHFQGDDVDRFSRLSEDAGSNDIHDYYRKVVSVNYHTGAGTIHLRVRAYSADAARAFADAILEAAQTQLDKLFAKSKQERVIVAVAAPSLPSAATYPKRLWRIATVFFVALVFMGIFGLLAAAVREHAKF